MTATKKNSWWYIKGQISKINSIELKLPDEPVFDTFALKQASEEAVKAVEQGKKS